MIRDGQGERRLPIIVRCRVRGEIGRLQVRPPVPTWTNANGWIDIPGTQTQPTAAVD